MAYKTISSCVIVAYYATLRNIEMRCVIFASDAIRDANKDSIALYLRLTQIIANSNT